MFPRFPVALALAGLNAPGSGNGAARGKGESAEFGPREMLAWAAKLGFRGVQLDGALAGVRARELDRSHPNLLE